MRSGYTVPTDLVTGMVERRDLSPEELDELASADAKRSRVLEVVLTVGVLATILGLWTWISVNVSPIVFPSPALVAESLISISLDGRLWNNLYVTVVEIILGFVAGSVMGIGLGALLARAPLAQRIANPYLIATQAMPKLALAPMLVLWFGFGITSKVVIAALIAFFPLLENTIVGLRSVPREEVRLFESLQATEWQKFIKLRVPTAMPYIFAGLRVAMLFATVGAVVGEYVGANVGLGAMIIVAYGQLKTAQMFAVMIVLTAVGIILYKAVEWAEARVRRRFPE